MQAEMKEYIDTHVREMLPHCLLNAPLKYIPTDRPRCSEDELWRWFLWLQRNPSCGMPIYKQDLLSPHAFDFLTFDRHSWCGECS